MPAPIATSPSADAAGSVVLAERSVLEQPAASSAATSAAIAALQTMWIGVATGNDVRRGLKAVRAWHWCLAP
jgi:hypothetical protein